MAPESWEAYQLDLVTYQTGKSIDNKLDERDKAGKPIYRLSELLAEPVEGQGEPAYRPLAGLVTKKMTIPENGIW